MIIKAERVMNLNPSRTMGDGGGGQSSVLPQVHRFVEVTG